MGETHRSYVETRLRDAEAGRPDAFYDLGLRYSIGQGVDQDLIEAHKWLNLAALRGVRRAQADRNELARDMTSAEIAEAQRQAREWLAHH